MNDSINQFKHVPNNVEGKQFIRTLRKLLKNTPNGVSVRGRGPRKPYKNIEENRRRNLRQDLPLKYATHFTVYITEKPKFRFVKRLVTKTEMVPTPVSRMDCVRVPTKWASPTIKAQFKSGISV
jgi:hypothetical protein